MFNEMMPMSQGGGGGGGDFDALLSTPDEFFKQLGATTITYTLQQLPKLIFITQQVAERVQAF